MLLTCYKNYGGTGGEKNLKTPLYQLPFNHFLCFFSVSIFEISHSTFWKHNSVLKHSLERVKTL